MMKGNKEMKFNDTGEIDQIDEVGNIEWMMKSITWMKSTKWHNLTTIELWRLDCFFSQLPHKSFHRFFLKGFMFPFFF